MKVWQSYDQNKVAPCFIAAGEYEVELQYAGVPVPGCPFYVRAYDLHRIKVSDLQDGVCGQETSFKSAYSLIFLSEFIIG